MIELLVPFYGPREQLFDLVHSVLAQTSPHWRLLVVDDAWPGDPVAPGLMALGDERIRYRRNPDNLGVNGNFQRCLDLAEEERVVFLGGDDLLLPSYVGRLKTMDALFPHASVIQPGVEVIGDDGTVVRPLADLVKRRLAPRVDEPTELGGEPLLASLLRGNWAYFPSLCWRREQIARIGFDSSYDMVMDLALLMQVLRDGGSLVVDPQVTFRYRRHDASYSALRALDGNRFADERGFFAREARALRAAGLTHAERSARLHLTSRLHALSLVAAAVRARRWDTLGSLLGHALGRTSREAA